MISLTQLRSKHPHQGGGGPSRRLSASRLAWVALSVAFLLASCSLGHGTDLPSVSDSGRPGTTGSTSDSGLDITSGDGDGIFDTGAPTGSPDEGSGLGGNGSGGNGSGGNGSGGSAPGGMGGSLAESEQ